MFKTCTFRIITLFFLILLASFTRIWNTTNLPPSLFSDEVDAGYQAMTLNRFGTDYFGNIMPTHFHSFSDWRTSAYIYTIAFFQHLGVDPELSVRLPSAVFGISSVLLIYLITNSYTAAFILSISPWAIHYSRTGFEVSGMITVILLGIYFFQKFSRTRSNFFLGLSLTFFCLSPYFYSTAKIFLPIIFLIIFLIWRKSLLNLGPKKIIFFILFTTLLLSPMIIDTFQGRSGFRFSYIGIFTEPHREQVTDQMRYEDILLDHPNEVGIKTPTLSFFLHNKYQLIVQRFINNYISSFSSNFLFLTGDLNIRHGFGSYGLLYFLDAVFILFGLYQYFKSPSDLGRLFLWMLILAPIPFSLTRDSLSAHSTRLILMLPSIFYFISIGIGKKFFVLPLYFLLFLNFWHYYTIHYSQTSAIVWHSGMKQSVLLANDYPGKKIYFSDTYEPFLPFFLFYHPFFPVNKLPISQNITRTQNEYFDGQVLNDQYYFGHINWSSIPSDLNNIYVVPQNEYMTIQNVSSLKILDKVTKKYLSAQEFYLLTSDLPLTTK